MANVQEVELAVPTRTNTVPGVDAQVFLFGKQTGSWRMTDPVARRRMAAFAASQGVSKIFAPSGRTFNTKVLEGSDMEEQFPESETFSQGNGLSVKVLWGALADGVANLTSGQAFWLASADCPLVVLTDGNRVVPTHGGRDSLLDRGRLISEGSSERPGVLDRAVALFKGYNPSCIKAKVFCGIGSDSFEHRLDHEKWGHSNERLTDAIERRWGFRCIRRCSEDAGFVSISLPHVIQAQLRSHGVKAVYRDAIDTFADVGDTDFTWWSCARGDSERNGVLVVRR